MSARRFKRIGIGLVATIVILIMFDLLPSSLPLSLVQYRIFGYFYFWSAVQGAIFIFVATFAGGYVAKVSFVAPAVLLSIGAWLAAVYFANSIAATAGEDNIMAVAGSNVAGLLFGAVGAAIGASVGRRVAGWKQDGASNAA